MHEGRFLMNIHPSILPDNHLLSVVPYNSQDPKAGVDIVITLKSTKHVTTDIVEGYIIAITPEGIKRYENIADSYAKDLNIPLNPEGQIECDEMEGGKKD